jgi:uncharacterized damage-inducible protein DinB
MKELLLLYAKYNVWANKGIIDLMLKLSPDKLEQEVISSFPSIQDTVKHIWGAESIWLQRLMLAEQPAWAPDTFTGSFSDLCGEWSKASSETAAFVEKQYDDRGFTHVLQYYNLQHQSVKMPVYVALNHAFNHSTYHRGQLVTMLRQVGVTKIPLTDFFVFAQNK